MQTTEFHLPTYQAYPDSLTAGAVDEEKICINNNNKNKNKFSNRKWYKLTSVNNWK